MRRVKVTLGIYPFRRQAEKVYEDLIESTSKSEMFSIPNPTALIEETDVETLNELQKHEEEWQKENNPGCGCSKIFIYILIGIVIIFVIIALTSPR